jgi:hypothetical protein
VILCFEINKEICFRLFCKRPLILILFICTFFLWYNSTRKKSLILDTSCVLLSSVIIKYAQVVKSSKRYWGSQYV